MNRLVRTVWTPALILILTVLQLAIAQWWPGIDRFADKAFGARLIAYPVLMLAAPAIWWLVQRQRTDRGQPPYDAFTLVMLPFLIDVTGNSLDLYDSVVWWDDFNHFFNWLLLLTGVGLLVAGRVAPRWAVVALVTGLGAVLAIGWELGEWLTFIRHGTELGSAYEDTLGDLTLGTLGALCAGLVVLRLQESRKRSGGDAQTRRRGARPAEMSPVRGRVTGRE